MSRISLCAILTALVVTVALPSDAFAQPRLGVHTGINTEGTDLFFGGSAQFGITLGDRMAQGSLGFEVYPFIDNVFISRINPNVYFNLLSSGGAELYGGGGLMIQLSKFDVPEGVNIDETDTDFGINVVGGVMLSGADRNYRPFLELNQTIGGGTDFAVRGGVFFKLGR